MHKQFTFILLLSCLFVSCSERNTTEEEHDETITKTEPASVRTNIIYFTDFSEELMVNGKIESAHSIELFFKNQGLLKELPIFNGKKVTKGDTLAILENKERRIQFDKARIALKEAENELNSLLLGFGGSVNDTTSVNKDILQSLKIRSGYSRAQLDLKLAQLKYESTFLLAPFHGVIADLNYQNDQYYSSSEPFCRLIDHQNYKVSFYVTESEWSQIHIGQLFKVNTINSLEKYLKGRITEINPSVDKHSLIQVRGLLSTSSNHLINGMNTLIVMEKIKTNSLVIPKKALVLRNNKKVVFTYKAGKAYWNYVETAGENSSCYLISKGLVDGDTVIVDGNLNLAHEAEVIIAHK